MMGVYNIFKYILTYLLFYLNVKFFNKISGFFFYVGHINICINNLSSNGSVKAIEHKNFIVE